MGEEGFGDSFPEGMRVLVVDDNRICLELLEAMLRYCKYNVTGTTQSIKALEILRKRRNQFDLVICDVNMSDMDGFKLLEIVAFEMDLPVIVMTGDKNTKLVMKCAIHGACGCLKKPPRMEELQYIWQHVVKKKIGSKNQKKASNEEKVNMVREGSQGITFEKNVDQNKMLGIKRKEQNEEEENDDHEEDGQDKVDPSNQKKPRFAWKADLHRKFVAAVNQLGFEKAVPRKILELMNTEGLTRQNVASHLQKYRLSLKKKAQQHSMVPALGNADQHGDFHSAGSGRSSSSTIPLSYPVQSQDMNCSINTVRNMQPSMTGVDSSALSQHVLSQKSSSSSLHSIPPLLEFEPFQQSNCTTGGSRQLSPIVDDSSELTFPSCYPNTTTVGDVNNEYLDDILSGMMKSGQNEMMMMSGEMGFDGIPVGLCM